MNKSESRSEKTDEVEFVKQIEPQQHDLDCEDKDDEPYFDSKSSFEVAENMLQNNSSNISDLQSTSFEESLAENSQENLSNETLSKIIAEKALNIYEHNDQEKVEKIVTVDASVQVQSGDIMLPYCSCVKTESDLITICNIKSFAILNKIAQLMDQAYPSKRACLLNSRQSIILTTAKLKLDISFPALTIFFNITNDVTTRDIFYRTLKKLARILQSVV